MRTTLETENVKGKNGNFLFYVMLLKRKANKKEQIQTSTEYKK